MKLEENPGPLACVVVVEVGGFIAAPFATMQLADLGATVFKIEEPGVGDPTRAAGPFVAGHSTSYARVNRNKMSAAIDLKSERGRTAFLALVSTADVLVENLRPGAMDALGLGYDDLSAENPRLVYASATGWGRDGELAHLPGLDIMAQARSGLMSITGETGRQPVKVGVPICDLTCALYLTIGILSALHERDRSGRGQRVDVSLYEAGVSLAVWEAGQFFDQGQIPRASGSTHQRMAPYQAVECADGSVCLGAVTPRTWIALCDALGLNDIRDLERFRDASSRHEHRDELIVLIENVTKKLSAAEIQHRLDAAGVPCAPVADYSEVFTSRHLINRSFFWDSPHPAAGMVRQLGSPMWFSRCRSIRHRAGPLLGQDTERVLIDAGLAPSDVGALLDRRPKNCPPELG